MHISTQCTCVDIVHRQRYMYTPSCNTYLCTYIMIQTHTYAQKQKLRQRHIWGAITPHDILSILLVYLYLCIMGNVYTGQ